VEVIPPRAGEGEGQERMAFEVSKYLAKISE
jgi:hypothetical protein